MWACALPSGICARTYTSRNCAAGMPSASKLKYLPMA